jgi:hypothetical protein
MKRSAHKALLFIFPKSLLILKKWETSSVKLFKPLGSPARPWRLPPISSAALWCDVLRRVTSIGVELSKQKPIWLEIPLAMAIAV